MKSGWLGYGGTHLAGQGSTGTKFDRVVHQDADHAAYREDQPSMRRAGEANGRTGMVPVAKVQL